GETHSDTDRDDKIERSGSQCVGKACDFLYWAGIGENSGPTHKDNHDKARTNFIDMIKVSRAQHIELENQIIEQKFLPTKDADVGELVLLCKRFLVHGNLVERVGQMTSILAKKSKTFKDKITDARESSQITIELNKLRTPAKKSERSQ
ncbi:3157_t:CDS:2, partial [Funneliformis geosporum]